LSQNPTVVVVDGTGRPLRGVRVAFSVVEGNGWVDRSSGVTDRTGRVSTTWYLGPVAGKAQVLAATVGAHTARFEASAERPPVGVQVFGADRFIEWIPGNLPIVISAPHGGLVSPRKIRSRSNGINGRDENTPELALAISDAFFARLGKRPHVIICHLARTKLDANRGIIEAAAGNPRAERAWREFHGFIEASIAEVRRSPGIGFYMDLHGHAHDIPRIELGYVLHSGALSLQDSQLTIATAGRSSLWPMAEFTGKPFAELLRGKSSLGAYLEAAGYASVPSATNPSPGNNPYYDGGYNTQRHGSSTGHRFAGVQIESQMEGVRDTPANRAAFANALVTALESFLGLRND
jgi:N-formylglutamate amidohydrolase